MNIAALHQAIVDARIHAYDLASELEDIRRLARSLGEEGVADEIMEIAQDVDNAAGALETLGNGTVEGARRE